MFRTRRCLQYGVLIAALSILSLRSPGAAESPDIKDAFAIVQRDGKPYSPFYAYYISPHAIVENGTVYTAHQDGEGRPIVNAYDIATKSWKGPVRASDFGLGADTHGNPSICIDSHGRILLFFGCHGRAMKLVRSTKPYDITAWEGLPSPTPRATYPEAMRMADGSIFLFYRAGGHMEPWSLRISRDDGATWSDAERIIEMRIDPPDKLAAAYCTFLPGPKGDTIHGFWLHKDDNPPRLRGKPHPWRPVKYPGLHEAVYRYNVYYIKREADGTWHGIDGTAPELPLGKGAADNHARVYDTGDLFARHKRIVIDENDRPYIRFGVGVTDWKAGKVIVPEKVKYAAPTDGKWRVYDKMPNDWPAAVRKQIETPGPAAYDAEFPGPWYIHFENGPPVDPTATYIWLAHTETGCATREGGPARSPEE